MRERKNDSTIYYFLKDSDLSQILLIIEKSFGKKDYFYMITEM